MRIFSLLDEPILDAICEKLRQKLYIRGSNLLYQGGTVEKMVFIVRGKLESIGVDGHVASLQEGDVCGEELITWYLEQHSSGHYKGTFRTFTLFVVNLKFHCQNLRLIKYFLYFIEGGKSRYLGLRLFSTRTVRCLTNVEAFALQADDLEEVISLFSRVLRNPRVQGAIR